MKIILTHRLLNFRDEMCVNKEVEPVKHLHVISCVVFPHKIPSLKHAHAHTHTEG